MTNVNLTIIGLGRVGTSFGLALKRYHQSSDATHNFIITGYDRDHKTCEEAKKLGALDHCARRLSPACEDADIMLIDAPLPDLKSYLEKIGPMLKAGCVVLETAPLKQPPIEWAKRFLPESAYLIGLTFVLNLEFLYGIEDNPERASADLFDVGHLYIAAAADCPVEAVQLATALGDLIGLKPHYLDPAEHDGMVASIEGVPILLSLALFNTASQAPSWIEMRRLTNPAFALAAAMLEKPPEALFDFLTLNRENTLHYLNQAIDQLETFRSRLSQGNDTALSEALAQTSKAYFEWWHQRRISQWAEKGATDMRKIRSTANLFGGLFGRFRKDDEDKDEA